MKNYEYAVAPTSQFFFCGIPFRFDIKPKCNLNCAYCFAMSRGGRRTDQVQIVNTKSFIKRYDTAIHQSQANGNIVSELLSNRVPLHIGGMSDPFSDAESTKVFDELCSVWNRTEDYPVIISTKKPSELIKRTSFLAKKNLIIQISLPIISSSFQSQFEPNADTIEQRLNAMKDLISSGHNVSCRIQPVIPQFIDSLITIIDILNSISCRHVILEFLKLPVEKNALNTTLISSILGQDILEYYHTHGASLVGREWLLPTQFRYEQLRPIKQYANQHGILVSLADYGLYHLSDSSCCCGTDIFDIDCNWLSGNFSALLHNKQGILYFNDIERLWHPQKHMSKYINSKSRLDLNTMLEHLQNRWNSPGTVNAPDCYLGVSFTGERDSSNNCIYFNAGGKYL